MRVTCKFCGKETEDYYMLRDHLWWKLNLTKEEYKEMLVRHPRGDCGYGAIFDLETPPEIAEKLGGYACLDCVRKGLGRELTADDFPIDVAPNLKCKEVFDNIYPKYLDEETMNLLRENKEIILKYLELCNKSENYLAKYCLIQASTTLRYLPTQKAISIGIINSQKKLVDGMFPKEV